MLSRFMKPFFGLLHFTATKKFKVNREIKKGEFFTEELPRFQCNQEKFNTMSGNQTATRIL